MGSSLCRNTSSDFISERIRHDPCHPLLAAALAQLIRLIPTALCSFRDLLFCPYDRSAALTMHELKCLAPDRTRVIVFDHFDRIGRADIGTGSASDADAAGISVRSRDHLRDASVHGGDSADGQRTAGSGTEAAHDALFSVDPDKAVDVGHLIVDAHLPDQSTLGGAAAKERKNHFPLTAYSLAVGLDFDLAVHGINTGNYDALSAAVCDLHDAESACAHVLCLRVMVAQSRYLDTVAARDCKKIFTLLAGALFPVYFDDHCVRLPSVSTALKRHVSRQLPHEIHFAGSML